MAKKEKTINKAIFKYATVLLGSFFNTHRHVYQSLAIATISCIGSFIFYFNISCCFFCQSEGGKCEVKAQLSECGQRNILGAVLQ